MPDCNDDYNTIRMIQDPQTSYLEINIPPVETNSVYHATVTGCPSGEGVATDTNLSLLPAFPSYFSGREEKSNNYANPKQSRSSNLDIHTHLPDSARSRPNHSII